MRTDLRPQPPALSGAQRRYLRGLAQRQKPAVWVGEGDASAGALQSLDAALRARELVKVRMRSPADKRASAESLARATGAALCGVVGHTAVLYRPHPEPDRRRIDLPGAPAHD